MEVHINMSQEDEQIISHTSSAQTVHNKSMKRLQLAITCCLLGLCTLTAFIVYQVVGGYRQHRDDKVKAANNLWGTKQDYSNPKPEALQWEDTLQWEDSRGLAFTKHGMSYNNRSLRIPKTGYYFIYSQVSFRVQMGSQDVKYFTLTIKRVNDNYPEPESLLSGTTSHGKGSEERRPIYLGALLLMREGDMLMVEVSDIRLVDVTVDHKTFFGAFLVLPKKD
ncbi:tumor necrosis factor ligand superfamily member 15 [Pelodytes ibericus]